MYSLSLPERISLKIDLLKICSFSDCFKILTKARRSCLHTAHFSFSSLGNLMLPSLHLSSFICFFLKVISYCAISSLSHSTFFANKEDGFKEMIPFPFYDIVYLLKVVVVSNGQDKCTLFSGTTFCLIRQHGLSLIWFSTLLFLILLTLAFFVPLLPICFIHMVFMSWLIGSSSQLKFLKQASVYQSVSLDLSWHFVLGFKLGFSPTSFSSLACAPSFPIHDSTSTLSHLHCVLLMMR